MKGHIRERSPGKWAIVLKFDDPATGEKRQKWHSFRGTKRQAQDECARLITQIKGGTYLPPDKTTVAEFMTRWLETIKPNVSPRTYERYKELTDKNILPLLGGAILSKLRPVQISEAYGKALASGRKKGGGLSPQTVLHMHRVLKKSLKDSVRWEILHRNPADAVTPPKVEKRPINAPDMETTAAVLESIREYRAFIPAVLAAKGGLRRGEIAALRWKRVDLETGDTAIVESAEQTNAGVRYKEPKSGKGRSVPLPESALAELRAWKRQQAEELLRLGVRQTPETLICTTKAGEGIEPDNITYEFLKALDGEKLPRVRFHDLRHAHASHLLRLNVHPKVVSERLGHSKIGITMDLYSHLIPTMQADAVAALDAAYRAAKKPA